jgi:hypothetical protein
MKIYSRRAKTKGNIVKFHSLRTSLVGGAFALTAALLLGSCGGGGASSTGQGGNLILLPLSGTIYAGMPFTFTIAGGRAPYRVSSSDQGILPVPSTVDVAVGGTTLTVIANNPGVIDNGLDPTNLQGRTVTVSITDFSNGFQQSQMFVAQNFLTGYGVSYTSNCTPVGSSTTGPGACAGGETSVLIQPTFNGSLLGNRTLRLDVVRGPFRWYLPNGTLSPPDGMSMLVTTDHEGKTNALFRVDAGVETQLALFRVTDVATGVSTEQLFTINGTPRAEQLTLIPNAFTFTGATSAECGTGTALMLAFDGKAPYHAVSTAPEVTVNPTDSPTNPGEFGISANSRTTCLTGVQIVVTDSQGRRGTAKVDTKVGTGAPPPTPLRAIPSTLNLTCGQSASSVVTGGTGAVIISSNSAPAEVGAVFATPVLTVTQLEAQPVITATPRRSAQIVLTDGTSSVTVTATYPNDCS